MDVASATSTAQQVVDTAVLLVSHWGLRVLGAIAVLGLGRFLAGVVRKSVNRSLGRTRLDETLHPFFASAAHYLLLTAVVIAVLNLFEIETTSLIALLATAGLAVGLALQGTLSNFAAGVMLLVFRPFRIGDFVEVGGSAGSVAEIGLFATTLNTSNNIRVIIPNGSIFGQVIVNYSVNDRRRIDLVIGIGYGDNIGTAIDIISTVLERDERVLKDPAPLIGVTELADSSVNLVVRPWYDAGNYGLLRLDLIRSIKEKLERGGCSIPFPQRDVHVVTTPVSG